MVIQQLEYIVAVDRFRHFAKAAEECNVSQPTLSAMIQKLEQELEVKIFDRDKHPVVPTEIGRKIILQAITTLNDFNRVYEIVHSEVNQLSGKLQIGIIPTISAYFVPDFIAQFKQLYPEVELSIIEAGTADLSGKIQNGSIDMGIISFPGDLTELFYIPLYKEKFVAYFPEKSKIKTDALCLKDLPKNKLWVLRDGHCEQRSLINACKQAEFGENSYEAGSIETLIRIVEKNNGYTIIPELHTTLLSDEQKANVRNIAEASAEREVSIAIRKDYIKERMLNAVVDTVKKIIPMHMLNPKIVKYAVRL